MSAYIGQEVHLHHAWRIERQIGFGGFGHVYAARSDDDVAGVVKFIPKAPGAERELLFEDLDGVPNVIPILDRGESEDYWLLVMPEAEQSLRDYLNDSSGRIDPVNAISILIDITEALAGIEDRVVHRDIKPENVLFHDGHWCLADFGISRYANATTAPDTRKYAKTYPYAAPEQWRGDRASSATDVYALGVVAYELLAGRRPFGGPDEHDFRRQHLNESPEAISDIPIQLRSLVDECLYKASEARPRPRNLLARWRRSVKPTSGAGALLQEVNANVVEQEAEVSRRRSVARTEAERRIALYDGARQSFGSLVNMIEDEISQHAPASSRSVSGPSLTWSLAKGRLTITLPKLAEVYSGDDSYRPRFDIIGYAQISVSMPRDRHGYKGRAHSLWYCDAQNEGRFRWYEVAFYLYLKRTSICPFALGPQHEAYEALAPITGVHQIARPLTPVDQGDEPEFVQRWLTWFAQAARQELSSPSRLPEP